VLSGVVIYRFLAKFVGESYTNFRVLTSIFPIVEYINTAIGLGGQQYNLVARGAGADNGYLQFSLFQTGGPKKNPMNQEWVDGQNLLIYPKVVAYATGFVV
jgi:hypothetical protein